MGASPIAANAVYTTNSMPLSAVVGAQGGGPQSSLPLPATGAPVMPGIGVTGGSAPPTDLAGILQQLRQLLAGLTALLDALTAMQQIQGGGPTQQFPPNITPAQAYGIPVQQASHRCPVHGLVQGCPVHGVLQGASQVGLPPISGGGLLGQSTAGTLPSAADAAIPSLGEIIEADSASSASGSSDGRSDGDSGGGRTIDPGSSSSSPSLPGSSSSSSSSSAPVTGPPPPPGSAAEPVASGTVPSSSSPAVEASPSATTAGGPSTGSYGAPLRGIRVTSEFGDVREWDDKDGHHRYVHNGIDLGASRGTPVLAADAGVIVKVVDGKTEDDNVGYGNYVEIKHDNGDVTLYGHLSADRVDVGQRVDKGQQIGDVGSTGNSTGPHLHFEVMKGGNRGNRVNPRHEVDTL